MSVSVGIALAFVSMLCWGIGDFLIQKSARKLGDWETLFVITIFGTIILLPFAYKSIPNLFEDPSGNLLILVSSALILLGASLLDFEGFKKGKLSVLEPLLSFEIPSAAFLAYLILGDHVTFTQITVIIVLIVSLFLISFREKNLSRKFFLEKGVIFFLAGAFLMGLGDFLLGWGSRETDPIIANFVLSFIMAVISGIVLTLQGKIPKMIKDIKASPGALLIMSIADNVAWVAYAFAMVLVPIAVATGLSESSIVIAVMLGIFVNKEKLQGHQKIGLVGAVVSAIVLAVITG